MASLQHRIPTRSLPASPPAPPSAPAASAGAPSVATARAVTERRAGTFAAACRLLPPDVRDDVYLLYLAFRSLDDLVDDGLGDAAERVAAVAAWAAGEPVAPTPETEIFAGLAARHSLPRDAIADFCAGMRQDLAGERFATERDLDRYCYRVAGTVGVAMAALLGGRLSPDTRAAAGALGMAMQRTNILRDIDEDRAAGRVYISAEARRRFGENLAPGHRGALMQDQIARADELYDDGLTGITALPRGRAAITMAAVLYREILRELERQGLGTTPGRVSVSAQRKLACTLRVTLTGR